MIRDSSFGMETKHRYMLALIQNRVKIFNLRYFIRVIFLPEKPYRNPLSFPFSSYQSHTVVPFHTTIPHTNHIERINQIVFNATIYGVQEIKYIFILILKPCDNILKDLSHSRTQMLFVATC